MGSLSVLTGNGYVVVTRNMHVVLRAIRFEFEYILKLYFIILTYLQIIICCSINLCFKIYLDSTHVRPAARYFIKMSIEVNKK